MEIGSGNGGLARHFKSCYPRATYILLDTPVIMYFAACHLLLEFPNSNHCFVSDPSEMKEAIEAKPDFIYLPNYFLNKVDPFDLNLVMSTHALGEMHNITVKFYNEFVERCGVEYWFSVNRFLHASTPIIGSLFYKYRRNENGGSLYFPQNMETLQWSLEPWFLQSPYFDQLHPQYLMVLLRRRNWSEHEIAEMKEECSHFCEHLKHQDWYEFYGKEPLGIVLYHKHRYDCDKGSTLQMLWDYCRVIPSRENLSMMLKFLRHFHKPFVPEEWFWYRDAYQKLAKGRFDDPFLKNKVQFYYRIIRWNIMERLRDLRARMFPRF